MIKPTPLKLTAFFTLIAGAWAQSPTEKPTADELSRVVRELD